MSPQRADDAAKNFRRAWLGASGKDGQSKSIRYPFTWSFMEWSLVGGAFFASLAMFTFVVPSAFVVVVGALLAARPAARSLAPDRPRPMFWLVFCCVVVLSFPFSFGVRDWLLPLWFPVALFCAAVSAWAARKKFGPYLDWNRPLSYWLRTLGRAARGPRLGRERDVDPGKLQFDPEGLSDEIDMEPLEPRVVTIRSKNRPVRVTELLPQKPKKPTSGKPPRRVPGHVPPPILGPYIRRSGRGVIIGRTEIRWK